MILLAVIAAAHGIQGAVKLKTFTEVPGNVLAYGPLRDEKGQSYTLALVRAVPPDGLVVRVDGVKNRNQAEALRGTKLYVDRGQLPDLEEETFYHSDLIGLPVQDLEGQDIGVVVAVGNFGAGDFLEVKGADGRLCTVPFTKAAVPHVRLPDRCQKGNLQVDRRFVSAADLSEGEGQAKEDQAREDKEE